MSSLRIGILIWSYWPGHEGGAERQCRRIVEHVAGRGVIYTVLTSRFSLSAASQEDIVGGKILRLGVLTPFENMLRRNLEGLLNSLPHVSVLGVSRQRWSWAIMYWLMLPIVWFSRFFFILALYRWFVRNANMVDVIHVQEAGWLAGVGAWLGNRHGIPVLAKTATSPALPMLGFDTPLRGLWNRWRTKCRYAAQHQGLADELRDAGISDEDIYILPNGVVIPKDAAKPELPGPVLYVGNFSQGSHWKAFDVLIQAWSQVHRKMPEARLNMLGGGDYCQWRRLAENLGCASSICFLGMVPDPSWYYKNACLFVLPSRVEGISNALLEAQSYGLPCVVSDIPGNLLVVERDVNGLVVPVGNSHHLAESIVQLLMNPDRRNMLGMAGRKRVNDEFNISEVVKRLIDVYQVIF